MAAPPALGALGLTFTVMRAMQFIGLVIIIGLSASFVADIVVSSYAVPPALIGTLAVACLAEVYVIISYILYWDSLLPLLIATAADFLCLIAGIVVACIVGKPVSYLDCNAFPDKGNTAVFLSSLFANVKRLEGNTFEWVAPSKPSCLQLKSIWGMSVALCGGGRPAAAARGGQGKADAGGGTAWARARPLQPPVATAARRPRTRSLGTTAMAQTAKYDDIDSADDLGIVNVPIPLPLPHRKPYLSPDRHRHRYPIVPPAAAGVMERAKSSTAKRAIRPKPGPLASLPSVPPVPVLAATGIISATTPDAPPKMVDAAVVALPARTRSRRKTLLERIEGWWDLGLLDKRQTLFRSQSRGMAEQKL
ncbi:hypothetical protein MY11210_007367 [Beauveria gryllotalpidicola]